MLTKNITSQNLLKIILASLISYYFAPIIIQSGLMAFVFLTVVLFVLLFLYKIEYAFYLILASRTIIDVYYDISAGGGNIKITHVIGGGLGVLFVFYIVVISKRNLLQIFNIGPNKILASFLIFCIPAVFNTYYLKEGVGSWFRLFQVFLSLNVILLMLVDTDDEVYKKKIRIICWVVILSLIVPYGIYIHNYIKGVHIQARGEMVQIATYSGTNNIFSYHLLSVLPFCLLLYSSFSRNYKKLLLLLIAGMFFTIYKGYVRNVWIGSFVFLATALIVRRKIILAGILLCIVATVLIFSPKLQASFQDIYTFIASDKSFFELDPGLFSRRMEVWQTNLSYFINKSNMIEKLFGNGFDSNLKIRRNYRSQGMPEHNNYLTLLVDTGILGLSFYVIYIATLFKEAFILLRRTKDEHLRNLALVFIPFLCSYVVICFATHILWNISFQYYFSTLAGLVISANMHEDRNRKNNLGISR